MEIAFAYWGMWTKFGIAVSKKYTIECGFISCQAVLLEPLVL
jgi:hypothetical protein